MTPETGTEPPRRRSRIGLSLRAFMGVVLLLGGGGSRPPRDADHPQVVIAGHQPSRVDG